MDRVDAAIATGNELSDNELQILAANQLGSNAAGAAANTRAPGMPAVNDGKTLHAERAKAVVERSMARISDAATGRVNYQKTTQNATKVFYRSYLH